MDRMPWIAMNLEIRAKMNPKAKQEIMQDLTMGNWKEYF
jgi:hypothetical protein